MLVTLVVQQDMIHVDFVKMIKCIMLSVTQKKRRKRMINISITK